MKDMSEYFGVIEDPRHSSYVTHKLEDVLTIVMCAVLCGLDKLDEIVAYEENNQENLKKNLELRNIPRNQPSAGY